MIGVGYGDVLAWGLVIAGIAFLALQPRVSLGVALAAAALTGMAAKTALLELV